MPPCKERNRFMKTCPTCKTTVFEDMEVCYACLHRFDAIPASAAAEASFADLGNPALTERATASAQLPELDECFLDIEDAPLALPGSEACVPAFPEWVIRLEMRNEGHPQRVWSMELNPRTWAALEVA